MSIDILEVLRLRGFDSERPFKLVRHQASDYDILDLQRRGWLEAYQAYQSKPVFDGLERIVAFVALAGTRARFEGVYQVRERRPGHEGNLPTGCPNENWSRSRYYYDLRREPGFEDLENRVVIEWGSATRAWHQRPRAKEVVQVLPRGAVLPTFDDYLGFTLTHTELRDLCSQPEANEDWRSRLRAVAGVYLILATTTGHQYVGSASGTEGIWGRWNAYATNGHGGNKLLRELVARDQAYPDAFSYSILQILPPTFARSAVVDAERKYKEKLGSRATGLNVNQP
ncbi:MAG: GIY-YIG nuclease family protein [Chloroflexi bacterium]|nr:GIY-YIG nuclease family protein [Chloroflexota bacterium]